MQLQTSWSGKASLTSSIVITIAFVCEDEWQRSVTTTPRFGLLEKHGVFFYTL